MVLTFYTKHALTTLMTKMEILEHMAFFKGADDQDWVNPPRGWGDAPAKYVPELKPRGWYEQDFEVGAQAMCQHGKKRLPVEVVEFHRDGPLLESEKGPCYLVRWLRRGDRRSGNQYSIVPKGDLSGPARFQKKRG